MFLSFDLLHPTVETRLVMKSLGQMLFKNSICDILVLIWSIRPLPTVQYIVVLSYQCAGKKLPDCGKQL